MELNSQNFPESEIKVPSIDGEPHLLISPVRKAYLDYIKRLLYQNYKAMKAQKSPYSIESILRLAELIELKAAAKSMVVPVYRKQITTMVSVIKHYTELQQPYPYPRVDLPKHKSKIDKTTQTDVIHNTIDCDKSNINNICDKYKTEQCVSDNIDLKMEELFYSNSPNDIFVDQINKTQLNLIMSEIENYGRNEENEPQLNVTNNSESTTACNNVKIKVVQNVSQNKPGCSKWLCEEYFQKKLLYQKLTEISDISIKHHQKVTDKYVDLFGYESEEEIMQSPIMSPAFIRSCRRRIEPWVKNHMGRFFIQYHVSSHLYKPLLKHLIYKCIQINQYPNDYEVYIFVKAYFELHGLKKIKSKADF